MGYSPWGRKRIRHDLAAKQQQHSFIYLFILSMDIYLLLLALRDPCELLQATEIHQAFMYRDFCVTYFDWSVGYECVCV